MTILNVIIVVGILIIMYIVKDCFTVSGRFWKGVGRQPDRALWLFMTDPNCVLDAKPDEPSQFVGPFRFYDLRGTLHKVFIRRSRIAEVQSRWLQPLGMDDAHFSAWARARFERVGEPSS